MHKLTIEDDEGKTVVVPLVRDEITIGRQDGNTIRLTERNISRRHARLRRQNGVVFVEDIGSYNGVKVNGARIANPIALRDGDIVIVGDYKLTLRSDRPTATLLQHGGGAAAAAAPVPPPQAPAPYPMATAQPAMPAAVPPPMMPQAAPGAATPAPVPMPAMHPQGMPPGPPMPAMPMQPGMAPGMPPGMAPPGMAPPHMQPGMAPPHMQPAPMGMVPMAAPPAPEAAMDGAPTIPVRTLADQGIITADSPAAGPPAKVVVISSNFAGIEFLLNRASLVIGRTPENDIVLNHKSISRHHAKIIRDGPKYVVVDLESANGVRVNGSEFERVDLTSGDVIELGHVRLRFITADDPVDYELASGGDRKKMYIAGGIVGAAAIAVVAMFALSGKKKPDLSPIANLKPAAAPAAPAAAPPAPSVIPTNPAAAQTEPTAPGAPPAPTPVAPATPPPGVPPGESVGSMLAKAKSAAQAEKWDEALELASKAILVSPTSIEASTLKKTAEEEKQNAERFANARAAVTAKRYDEALAGLAEIPETSLYRKKSAPLQKDAQSKAVAMHLQQAQKMRAAGQCDDAKQEAEAVLALEGKHAGARAVIDGCSKVAVRSAKEAPSGRAAARSAAAAARTPPAAKPTAVAMREPAPAPAPARATAPPAVREPPARPAAREPARPAARPAAAPAEPTGDADSLVNDARQSWLKGQYAAAIESARRALRLKPGLMSAYQIIAVCSCSLRDAEGATRAYEKLDDRNKQLVKLTCQRNGVVID